MLDKELAKKLFDVRMLHGDTWNPGCFGAGKWWSAEDEYDEEYDYHQIGEIPPFKDWKADERCIFAVVAYKGKNHTYAVYDTISDRTMLTMVADIRGNGETVGEETPLITWDYLGEDEDGEHWEAIPEIQL